MGNLETIQTFTNMKMRTILFGLALLMSVGAMAEVKIVAHRGYWRTAGSAQNSITSYKKADQVPCYGSEIDIWISKDGVIYVNHDKTFKGCCIEKSTAAECDKVILDNGEKMPTFEEYLKVVKQGKAELVIEVKTHDDLARQNLCIDKAVNLVKKYKLQNRVSYIAFDLAACLRIIEKAPKGTEVYYLNGDLAPKTLKRVGCAGIDYRDKVLKTDHPKWIDECHRLGMKVNVWTVDTKEDLEYFVSKGVDYITTNEPELLKSILKK